MEQAAVVRAQGGGMFGQGQTLRIEERAFDYNVRDSGQEYKFFLVVRPYAAAFSLPHLVTFVCIRHPQRSLACYYVVVLFVLAVTFHQTIVLCGDPQDKNG